ncbi:hypothetical protein PHYPO_G00155880 [Pangasianodon hypophthalmus]|uniref:B30.2/SPRY domain-containing protein n=1 Tax=Pangasianodon hypophthalmus TaxID=310915 RepID=A0A5N5K023_PANHP|nr:hypothetical protein PHYPO_G00155880 [Pangasianodon hypophthalmus]
MFPNVSLDSAELLFLRLMIAFSVWIWKKRSLTRTISSQHITESLQRETEKENLDLSTEVLQKFLASHKANMKKKIEMEPKSEQFIKAGIKKYACDLTFNPNTAHTQLCLSESNKKVSSAIKDQQYPDHPERFQVYHQVLCNESLSHRSYWEVLLEGSSPEIGITYPDIRRKEEDLAPLDAQMKLGLNPISWVLMCVNNKRFYARHNSEDTDIDMPKPNRIGVYLDWPAGTLSFYSVSPDTHTLKHIHTFCTLFEKPVLPGFSVESGCLTLCQLD